MWMESIDVSPLAPCRWTLHSSAAGEVLNPAHLSSELGGYSQHTVKAFYCTALKSHSAVCEINKCFVLIDTGQPWRKWSSPDCASFIFSFSLPWAVPLETVGEVWALIESLGPFIQVVVDYKFSLTWLLTFITWKYWVVYPGPCSLTTLYYH